MVRRYDLPNVVAAWDNPRGKTQRRNYFGGRGSGNLMAGGLVNLSSGLGTSLDKTEGNFFTPTRIYWRTPLEILCVQSWVARNCIDIPNDDMFIRWREHKSDDVQAAQAMMDALEELKAEIALNQALKAGDQYGTGVVVMVTEEAMLDEPLDPKRIREGDLKALHYFDRYDLSVTHREHDFYSPYFGTPTHYQIHPTHGGAPMLVHHSRVLRFDGIRPPTKSGFTIYEQDFGVSVLVPIIISLMEDQTIASAISHMSQEASIPVLHIAGLRESIAGGGDDTEASPEQIGAQINAAKSIYRLLMLDEPGREEFMRVAVNFQGTADLMDKYSGRVASARKIPRTRFLGSPPIGMSATGESDMKNYVMMMEAERARRLKPTLYDLDVVIARHVGLREPPEYEWMSLLELSDQEIAAAAKTKAEALQIANNAYWLDEDEAREALNGDPIFGDLAGPAPEEPEPEPIDLPQMPAPKMPASTNGR